MTLWTAKGMGIMFGGVTDEDKHEETLESVFHDDLYGYQTSGNGRWVSLLLKKPKQGKGKKKKVAQDVPVKQEAVREDSDQEGYEDGDEVGGLSDGISLRTNRHSVLPGVGSSTRNTEIGGNPYTVGGRS